MSEIENTDFEDSRFFYLETQDKGLTVQLSGPPFYLTCKPRRFWPVMRGEEIPQSPLEFSIYRKGKVYDIVNAFRGNLCSPRFFSILEGSKLTGWAALPIKVIGVPAENPLHDYKMLTVTGRCGPRIEEKSPRVRVFPTEPGQYPHNTNIGFFFDESTWDGSDFFCAGDQAGFFITAKARTIMQMQKLKNVAFKSTQTGHFSIYS
jgi:hypothetical protein